jgi:hypothetical protein
MYFIKYKYQLHFLLQISLTYTAENEFSSTADQHFDGSHRCVASKSKD